MTAVHVWGASGYAAAETIRLLHAHPLIELGVLESRSHAGQALADHFPLLRTTPYRFDAAGAVAQRAGRGDVVLTAGGHGEARTIVPALIERGVRVIDLSADYRFEDGVAYGLAEFERDAIAGSQLVANPGCYPTASLLALLPLAALRARPATVAIDAKSGISGAGRTPSVGSLFAEVSGDVRAYGVDGHRHQPEIERRLGLREMPAEIVFTPHVVPVNRGMLVDVYAMYDEPLDPDAVAACYVRAYAGTPFVRTIGGARVPSIPAVVGTNDAELRVDVRGRVVRAICAIDNLGKGAAGQAVQNLNIMLGYPEEAGCGDRAVVA